MTLANIHARIDGLFMGQVQEHWQGRPPSAIQKMAVEGPRVIDQFGFTDDAQADLENHGGHDKAIHHYAFDHYAAWIAEDQIPTGTMAAAFGENISTLGLTEDTLCIGDILKLGTATVQISQGRQPCWKVSEHTGNEKMAYLFQSTGRTGWYYRVLEHGEAQVGDEIVLIERPAPEWTVKRVTSGRLKRDVSQAEAETLATLSVLAEGWRQVFTKMAAGQRTEDTSRRLQGS